MEYSKTVPFTGKAARALNVALSAFVNEGFQITSSTDDTLEVKGAGLSSTKQNPLKGVSEAHIAVRPSTIEMRAKLGGAEKMKKFLFIFPAGMFLMFMIVFGVLAFELPAFRRPLFFLIPALALSPWIFLAPLMARSISRKTEEALDTLLSNMIMMGRDV